MWWSRRKQTPAAGDGLRQAWASRGWRRSVVLFAAAALLTFIANLSFTLWAVTTHGTTDGSVGIIVEAECTRVHQLNLGAHVVINTLSTILLAGSNYCMQVLSSPTRSQIDEAHKTRRWMDVGVSSVRNMFRNVADGKRVLLWLLLGLSSLPLHLFYNSAVFQSISVSAYSVWAMSEDWVATGNTSSINKATMASSNQTLPSLHAAITDGRLTRLNTADCASAYAVPFQSAHSDLILITAATSVGNNPTTPSFGLWVRGRDEGGHLALDKEDKCGSTQAFQWMCAQYQGHGFGRGDECDTPCEQLGERVRADAAAGVWAPFGGVVEYCYSMPSEEHCKLRFDAGLLYAVIALNFGKAVLMLLCAFGWRREPPLLTVGDAVASFLRRPDDSTEDMCLLTRDTADFDWKYYEEQPVYVFEDHRRRKYKAASGGRWLTVHCLLLAAITMCCVLLGYGVSKIKGNKDVPALFSLGLGAVSSQTLISSPLAGFSTGALLANVVLANLPQLLFSLLYLAYNGIFTTLSLAAEWASFARRCKGLRLSGRAAGAQRAAYFLQLPYRLALPLVAVSGALHWLISQALFLVYVEQYIADEAYNGTRHMVLEDPERVSRSRPYGMGTDDIITCGWSPAAVVGSVVVGVVMMGGLGWFGARRLPNGMPVAGSCSAAIAAACHPLVAGEREPAGKIWEKPVQWGVTVAAVDGKAGHCSFSSEPVAYPVAGVAYL